MGLAEVVVVVVVVIGCVGYFRSRGSRNFDESIIDWDAILDSTVQADIQRKRKISAIKTYRELTGATLKDAKQSVEFAIRYPEQAVRKKKRAVPTGSDAGLRELVAQGKLGDAADVYRDFTGVDKYTADEMVNKLAKEIELGNKYGLAVEDDHIFRLIDSDRQSDALLALQEIMDVDADEARQMINDIRRELKSWKEM